MTESEDNNIKRINEFSYDLIKENIENKLDLTEKEKFFLIELTKHAKKLIMKIGFYISHNNGSSHHAVCCDCGYYFALRIYNDPPSLSCPKCNKSTDVIMSDVDELTNISENMYCVCHSNNSESNKLSARTNLDCIIDRYKNKGM